MRIGVVGVQGAPYDDVLNAVRLGGALAVELGPHPHDLSGADALVLTDTVDTLSEAIVHAAQRGLPVLGIGRGFGALCAAGLLPGSLLGNDRRTFVCREQRVRVESRDTVWTCAMDEGQNLDLVLTGGGLGFGVEPDVAARLETNRQVVLRYVDVNPDGSVHDIAGITNEIGTVVGVLVRPEYAVEALTGPSEDGLLFLGSVLSYLRAAA